MHPSSNPAPEGAPEFQPTARGFLLATATVAAVYAYFLVFAQFGFLHALTGVLGERHPWLRPILAIMAVSGIAGGAGCARLYTEPRGRGLLRGGFGLAALAAVVAGLARSPLGFSVAALATGMGLGFATVALAALLRREIGGARLGLCIGLGTGVAYGLGSLPAVFHGAASHQLAGGVVAAVLGFGATYLFKSGAPAAPADGADYQPRGIALWIGVFLVLVGSDSAAFYAIQHEPALRAAWPDGAALAVNAGVHVAAAVLAGLALDRRRLASTVLVAVLMLAGASLWFAGGPPPVLAAYLYSAGVSVYSVALVFYPAQHGQPGLAALLYAVAGWIGSALGIGLAENLSAVPGWLPVGAFVAIAGLLSVRAWRQ